MRTSTASVTPSVIPLANACRRIPANAVRICAVYQPVVVVGHNFVPGLTTVRFVGEGFDGFVATDAWKRRVGGIVDSLPFGLYQVTAYNGSLASETITVRLE